MSAANVAIRGSTTIPAVRSLTRAQDGWRRSVSITLALAIVLRVALALVNTQANDDHLAVVRFIIEKGRMPGVHDLWQGYQPKLYHATVAALWEILPISSSSVQIRVAQLVSCVAGIGTLLVVLAFLRERTMSHRTRWITFAFVALNPALIGINAQATNDSFIIFFGSVAFWQGARFFNRGDRRSFWLMTGTAALAGISKGQGILVAALLGATFLGVALLGGGPSVVSRRKLIYLGLGFAAVFAATATLLGPYRQTAATTGNPLTQNQAPNPSPPLFDKPFKYGCTSARLCFRPGTTSIASADFTFRLDSLLVDPYTTQGFRYSVQRTSLWARVYASANSIHFDQWPPSWADRRGWVLDLTRSALVLALIPTALLAIGMLRAVALLWRRLRQRGTGKDISWADVLLAGSAVGFTAALVLYTIRYRDFSDMKAIYLLPAVVPFTYLFANECERLFARLARRHALRVGIQVVFAALLLVYVTDVLVLVGRLA